MDNIAKYPRIEFPSKIGPIHAKPIKTMKLCDILDYPEINFNMGKSCAESTANNIGYTLDSFYYSDHNFAMGYAQSMGYIHGINGKEQNWSKSAATKNTSYESIRVFEQSTYRRTRIMNAVNSIHTFVISDNYKLDYIRGWIYGQYEMRYQHDMYSKEQQGFIYAQSDPDKLPKLDANNPLHICSKFILGFCAGLGYRDYKRSNNRNILTFSSKFDEVIDITKEECQTYYDLFYTDPP
jgi:hypothetical protein